MVIKLLE